MMSCSNINTKVNFTVHIIITTMIIRVAEGLKGYNWLIYAYHFFKMFIDIALSELSLGPSVSCSLNVRDIMLVLLPIGCWRLTQICVCCIKLQILPNVAASDVCILVIVLSLELSRFDILLWCYQTSSNNNLIKVWQHFSMVGTSYLLAYQSLMIKLNITKGWCCQKRGSNWVPSQFLATT